jgi:hypothetical protein
MVNSKLVFINQRFLYHWTSNLAKAISYTQGVIPSAVPEEYGTNSA